MKLNLNENFLEEDNGWELESSEAKIDAENLPIIFALMSNIYQDKYGSIIRELVSNACDAHKEKEVEEPVIVGYATDDTGSYIYIQDFGNGMSPKFMFDTFMSYFSSTKRLSDSLKGGFGIGSKSPLSYTDSFYIDTTTEGVRRSYLIYKTSSLPKCDLISEIETEEIGTKIRIYLEQESDSLLFGNACKQQLMYFDTVYFKNMRYKLNTYSSYSVENHFTIIDKKTFKYRTDTSLSEMHLSLDDVYYPINWKLLNRKRIDVPLGIKVNIGEIRVTPSREAIEYDERSIKIINNKIDLAIRELLSFVARKKELDLHEVKKLERFKARAELGNGYTLQLTKDSGLPFREIEYFFKGTTIPFIDISGVVSYSTNYHNYKPRKYEKFPTFCEWYERSSDLYVFDKQEDLTTLKKAYLKYLKQEGSNILLLENKPFKAKRVYRAFQAMVSTTKVKTILDFYKYYKNYLSAFKHIKDLEVPEWFIEDRKENRVNLKGRVKNYTNEIYKLIEEIKIPKTTKQVIYGFKGQENFLELLGKVLNPNHFHVIRIHNYMQREIEKIDDFIYVSDFFHKHRAFRNIATVCYIKEKFWFTPVWDNLAFFNKHLPYLAEDLTLVRDFVANNNKRLDTDFTKDLLEIANQGNLFNIPIKLVVDNIDRKFKALPLLPFIELDDAKYKNLDSLKQYFKSANLALLPEKPIYQKPIQLTISL